MSRPLDPARITELQRLTGAEFEATVGSLAASMASAIAEVEAALASGELDRATRGAHRCRNDALLVGARDVQRALSELESAARARQQQPASDALERLRAVWPRTRQELEHIAKRAERG